MESDEIQIDGLCFEKFLGHEELQVKIKSLGDALNAYFGNQTVQLFVLMEGARYFYEALRPHMSFPHRMIPLKLKTYEGLHPARPISIPNNFRSQWTPEMPILIVEDIIDTGRTLWKLLDYLKAENCYNVQIVSLLVKPKSHEHPVECLFHGFTLGPEFVVGFGMDYNEKGRPLTSIYRLKKENGIIDKSS